MTLVASDDGVHADGTLTISGGNALAKEAWESVEGNIINVTGGETIAYAEDDAVIASKSLNVTGGYLFGAVGNSGDYDGIDSNGTITANGGTLIGSGPASQMAAAFDCDGSISVPNLPYTYSGCYAWSSLGSISSIS